MTDDLFVLSTITALQAFVITGYAGNVMEARSAYEAAIHAVFEQQVECHRHVQTHVSSKTGKAKWTMMEMWPMLVHVLAHLQSATCHAMMCELISTAELHLLAYSGLVLGASGTHVCWLIGVSRVCLTLLYISPELSGASDLVYQNPALGMT